MKNPLLPKTFFLKLSTRSQKRKAAEELVSRDVETPLTGNDSEKNLISGPSKSPKVQLENVDEIKTSLGREIMSDLSKILAENQKEKLKSIAPVTEARNNHQDIEDLKQKTYLLLSLLHQLKIKRLYVKTHRRSVVTTYTKKIHTHCHENVNYRKNGSFCYNK